MKAFTELDGLVCAMDRANVDTDAIIPKQFLKSIKRSGFGPNLFDEWRYLDHGEPGMDNSQRKLNPEFELNLPRNQGAQILLTRDNFGCGSSREHAPWAIEDYGFCALIAPSFADIFFNNCFKNGLLPIVQPAAVIDQLFEEAKTEGYRLNINLPAQTITTPSGQVFPFEITEHRKHCLLNGLDEIGLTLAHSDKIKAFEAKHQAAQPWLFVK
ncbi:MULTISPECIES: 3-isopropylmalate dehydratase small subunit [Deefgea]|uniref:3-isopropylmalate dehydratase small subunit n=1 Tax=Deefgea chitinilytica TaxID=570276 RepID=A0ABS2C861_9NEIS|nr:MULTISPECIES: 3-isopropylmalate dehydratase small subunit [Deefgea]MBM5570347.1 3-isopropylmalate dehydratase small subunit [Deefgea chitinilytica]MBM9887576.1 3-isopropylmalate dehydratase small subunit [Deefgea sp. CFH1-16]